MNRLFLLMVMLCVVASGHSKRKIDLRGQARCPEPPIEAYIDGKVLEFEITDELGTLDIIIEDVSGNVVYRSTIDGNNGIIPLDLKEEEYVLVITSEEQVLWGNFSVEL